MSVKLLIPPIFRPYICPTCQVFRRRQILLRASCASRSRGFGATASPGTSRQRSSDQPPYWPPSESGSAPSYVNLSNRSLIRLQGSDVVNFLNGLLPVKLQPAASLTSAPLYTAFLTAKGRILHDAFVYPQSEAAGDGVWYIEVDQASAAEVLQHLKKHKLRSKIKLERVPTEEMGVHYIWPSPSLQLPQLRIGGQDPRQHMGLRILQPTSEPSQVLDQLRSVGTEMEARDYKIHRIITGHAEGPTELFPQHALPQESNIDFSRGIDFHKGCYLGQELTIRTHHTGVVRKRILPVQLYTAEPRPMDIQDAPIYDASVSIQLPPPDTNISKVRSVGRAGRATGKWLDGVGNVGLALCRLEMMTDIQLTAESTMYSPADEYTVIWEDGGADADGRTALGEVKLKPFVPSWLRNDIALGNQARADRGKRQRRAEDDPDRD